MKATETQNHNLFTNHQAKIRHYFIVIVFLLLLVVGLYQLWLVWPSLLVASIQWQRDINAEMSDLLYYVQSNPVRGGAYLAGLSFLYGMLHSLGPGHGKVIVTTYLATHPTKVKASLMLTVISAFFQALVAIILVSVLLWGFDASMRVVNQQATFVISLSFALVVILGLLICYKAIKRIYRVIRPAKLKEVTLKPLVTPSTNTEKPLTMKPVTGSASRFSINQNNDHVHSATCGCGHQHVADADAINQASTWREYISIVASIGMRPCTGAIMVLLFANVVGLYWMGVISAIVMAVGTALSTSSIALMTLTGKHLVKRYLTVANKTESEGWKLASVFLQFFGGILLVLIGLLLMNGQDYGISTMFL